jgi:hypothetical protein
VTSGHPVRRVGGASPGGLALPAAAPTAGQMYAPRGVWTDGRRLVVTDTGNHRVLIWHALPDADGADADVVLGQADFTGEGPAAGGRGPERGLHLPSGVGVVDGMLVVADGWHHRLVVWDGIPEVSDAAPAFVLGQPDVATVAANRGGDPALDGFYWPFGFGTAGGAFWVADTGNRRVLGWTGGGLPEPGRPADVLLGQDAPDRREDNRGGAVAGCTFRWPHDVAGDGDRLYVADAGDHRVLGWAPVPDEERDADLVLGQADLASAEEFKNRPQGPGRLRFPYAVALAGQRLAVADTSNNRILLWDDAPRAGAGVPADAVLAQPDLDANGENRWDVVADDSLCWPYGLCLAGDLLAVADSGNNRAVLWRLT